MQQRKKIILASPRGFCAGVDRAINIVTEAIRIYGPPVYVRHAVVHNKFVVDNLIKSGAIFIENINEVPDNAVLIYSAHGVSRRIRNEAATRDLRIILDATCPLVNKVHVEIKSLAKLGYYIIMIGHSGHPEVDGTMGQVDSNQVVLLEDFADIDRVCQQIINLTTNNLIDINKLALTTQTTLSVSDTRIIIDELIKRFPQIKLPKNSDICYATENRQKAVLQLADICDAIIVLGSKNSSNSNRLHELILSKNIPGYLIDNACELQNDWLDNIIQLGVTASASAPSQLVDELIDKLKEYNFIDIEELDGIKENIHFSMPKELKIHAL